MAITRTVLNAKRGAAGRRTAPAERTPAERIAEATRSMAEDVGEEAERDTRLHEVLCPALILGDQGCGLGGGRSKPLYYTYSIQRVAASFIVLNNR